MSNNQPIPHSVDLTVQGPATYQPAPYQPAGVPAGVFRITPAGSNPKSAHYLWLLRRHWWKCLLFAGASVAAAAIVSARITPLYESTATVDIDRQVPAGIIGQESARPGGNDADQFLATQVKVIQSDSVLRRVALRYRLVDAARADSIPSARGPILHQDTPIVLTNLKVTRPPNTYLLAISYISPDPQLSADVGMPYRPLISTTCTISNTGRPPVWPLSWRNTSKASRPRWSYRATLWRSSNAPSISLTRKRRPASCPAAWCN
jgi:hypothetical protein